MAENGSYTYGFVGQSSVCLKIKGPETRAVEECSEGCGGRSEAHLGGCSRHDVFVDHEVSTKALAHEAERHDSRVSKQIIE